jgi:hypothetical protein
LSKKCEDCKIGVLLVFFTRTSKYYFSLIFTFLSQILFAQVICKDDGIDCKHQVSIDKRIGKQRKETKAESSLYCFEENLLPFPHFL